MQLPTVERTEEEFGGTTICISVDDKLVYHFWVPDAHFGLTRQEREELIQREINRVTARLGAERGE